MRQFSVSVIIPTFNRPTLLAQAVRSVLNQTCRALEIIIIDNGSDPEHLSELSRIENSYDSINLVRLQSNKGPGYARNIGIEKSNGDWILFLDDDDILAPDFIEACFKSIRFKENAEMVIARAVCFREGSPVFYPRDAIGAINLRPYKKDPITTMLINGITIGSCLVNRKSIGSLRFREDIWHGEDMLFWFSLMQKIKNLTTTDIAFSGVRQHSDKITLRNNPFHPDGSPTRSKETYIRIMLDSMEDKNQWNEFTLKIIFQRIADNSWYSPSMIALLMNSPLYGARILNLLLRKRLYRYRMMLTDKILKRTSLDFTWLQR
jgi:glycosyltransferase involved in cell wall biosynthesis